MSTYGGQGSATDIRKTQVDIEIKSVFNISNKMSSTTLKSLPNGKTSATKVQMRKSVPWVENLVDAVESVPWVENLDDAVELASTRGRHKTRSKP